MPDPEKQNQPPEQTNSPTTGTGEGGQQPAPPESQQLGESGLRALEAERSARREAERKLKEATEAAEREKLTEKQRLEKERDEAASKAAAHELELMRIRTGLKAGVPAHLVHRLQGDTEAEVKADAEALVKELGQQGGGLGGGARGTSEESGDMNVLIRRAAGRQ
jgi:hypothetical protein